MRVQLITRSVIDWFDDPEGWKEIFTAECEEFKSPISKIEFLGVTGLDDRVSGHFNVFLEGEFYGKRVCVHRYYSNRTEDGFSEDYSIEY